MKRKILLTNIFTVLFSIFLFLAISLFSVIQVNRNNSESFLRNQLSIAQSILEEKEERGESISDMMQETSDIMTSSTSYLRITFLNADGEVLFDSAKDAIQEENHLQRPEIQNLGTIYVRMSDTIHMKMMYIDACSPDISYYVRIAFPLRTIDNVVSSILIFASLFAILLTILCSTVNSLLINHELNPLKVESVRLAKLVNRDTIEPGDELESIALNIEETERFIQQKVDDLTREKEKLNYIIDQMKEGLIIVDDQGNIILINERAKEFFPSKSYQRLIDVTILPEIIGCYQKAMLGVETSREIQSENEALFMTSQTISTDWSTDNRRAVSLFFSNISEEKKLENAKKDFFANASHELKSPLTSILGYAQMIEQGFLETKEEVKEALEKIRQEGKRMNDIISEMLDLSRLESESKSEEYKVLSLQEALEHNINLLLTSANEKNIEIRIEGENFSVYLIKEDLDILLKNLLENAIRYNKQNGKVLISLVKEKHLLSIQDTGIGIPEESLSRIFERFYRVDKSRSRKLGGTGLGLSIVKHICTNERIQIHVASKLDEGTTFTLTFPSTLDLK